MKQELKFDYWLWLLAAAWPCMWGWLSAMLWLTDVFLKAFGQQWWMVLVFSWYIGNITFPLTFHILVIVQWLPNQDRLRKSLWVVRFHQAITGQELWLWCIFQATPSFGGLSLREGASLRFPQRWDTYLLFPVCCRTVCIWKGRCGSV